ncbi:MAG: serine/threonine-protein phosphatase [Bacteroidetes bacterium]|nr:MAG: serine/threonine-protein phosphatase [Bacteroidota bacterium]
MERHYELAIWAGSDRGRVRPRNEDAFAVWLDPVQDAAPPPEGWLEVGARGVLLAVADGMGGLEEGELAARSALAGLHDHFQGLAREELPKGDAARDHLRHAFRASQERVVRLARATGKEVGTTLVAAWVLGSLTHLAWCGDSRAYAWHPADGLARLTKDHSLVQAWVEEGRLSPEEAFDHPYGNIVTRFLGNPNYPSEPEAHTLPLRDGLCLLLCSDGLNAVLRDAEIENLLAPHTSPADAGRALLEEVLRRGAPDNVTLVLAKFRGKS